MNKIIVLDTNILVLFVVGGTSLVYIEKHKRLSAYSREDFNLLVRIIRSADRIVTTPNILTEVSNLCRYIGEPACSEITRFLGSLIENTIIEKYVESKAAKKQSDFVRIGLTDAALIEALEQSFTLITDDFDLYKIASKRGFDVLNFTHIREAFLT
jgi:hypothetical protein